MAFALKKIVAFQKKLPKKISSNAQTNGVSQISMSWYRISSQLITWRKEETEHE